MKISDIFKKANIDLDTDVDVSADNTSPADTSTQQQQVSTVEQMVDKNITTDEIEKLRQEIADLKSANAKLVNKVPVTQQKSAEQCLAELCGFAKKGE